MKVYQSFLREEKKEKLIRKNDRILVAFSGGKDSVCLLFLLKKAKAELGISQIAACHIHHGIRGEEADRDADFCRRLCEEHKIDYYEKRVNVPSYCEKEHLGLEEGARILRYEALEQFAEAEGFHKIATAHTSDDQAETLLFRLARGTGIAGTCGIPRRRGSIIRPILSLSQEDVFAFLRAEGLPFINDSSNDDIVFSRNRLRHKVLPALKEINPDAVKALHRFATLSAQQEALTREVYRYWTEQEKVQPEQGSLPLSKLKPLTETEGRLPILYLALSKMCEKEKIVIDFERFDALVSLLKEPCQGKIIEIQKDFVFYTDKDNLCFGMYEQPIRGIAYHIGLREGENSLPSLGQTLFISYGNKGKIVNINKKCLIIHAAPDKIKGELFARNLQTGDTIRINGMTKQVKKLLCDAHIPQEYRHQIPLICDEEEIVWLPFVGLCDKLRDETAEEYMTLRLFGGKLCDVEKIIERKP